MLSLLGNSFLRQDTVLDESALNGVELIGLYFSALWCGPCRHFTPLLSSFYEKVNAQKKVMEIFFVSKDHNNDDFLHYYKHMPFLAMPFNDPQRLRMLFGFYRVSSIPTLVVLDHKGRFLTREGKHLVESMGVNAVDHFLHLKNEMYSDLKED